MHEDNRKFAPGRRRGEATGCLRPLLWHVLHFVRSAVAADETNAGKPSVPMPDCHQVCDVARDIPVWVCAADPVEKITERRSFQQLRFEVSNFGFACPDASR